jgi:hypothetical protein
MHSARQSNFATEPSQSDSAAIASDESTAILVAMQRKGYARVQ